MTPFNKPFLTGNEVRYICQAVASGKLSGDGVFTKKCHRYFEKRYGFKKCLLTTSCTDALEMCALLLDIQPGDEVIMPSFTFVSTANAFVLRGAKIIFADSNPTDPNLDIQAIEPLINSRTKAIVAVHYAGMACDMDALMQLAERYRLWVVEDAAQAVDAFYKGRPLGSIGHLAAFSFHETKNVQCGEGGMLVVNDPVFMTRSEIIREKGTNRSAFFRGETDKYGWVDIGSSFLPSEVSAAFLFAQLEELATIQAKRISIWNRYHEAFERLSAAGAFQRPRLPEHATNNAHLYYILCNSPEERTSLIALLKERGILAVFHYLSLHRSPYYQDKHDGRDLPNSDRYMDCLLRLPLYFQLTEEEQDSAIDTIFEYYQRDGWRHLSRSAASKPLQIKKNLTTNDL